YGNSALKGAFAPVQCLFLPLFAHRTSYSFTRKRAMRKIIVTEFITLDGVVEAPGGNETAHPNGGWQNEYRSAEGGKYKMDELAGADALLLGKNTYEAFAKYWPTQSGEGFADPINRYPKYV